MAIPQSFIQELLARADVVDIVGRYVQLKKGGANYMGLCPFHGEKSPSFSVSPAKQFYHCFGCGKNGNAIGFLMDHTGMSFVEAVKDLAGQYGLQVPDDGMSAQDRAKAAEQRQRQATLTDVLEKACDAYKKHLKTSPRAIAYFKGRGVSGQVARDFGLGYAPEGWRSLASVFPNYDDPLLVDSGLVILHTEEDNGGGEEKRYDRFRDRVMFPIRNVKGECIGFGGRVLGDEKPKYLNSPETPVFSKGRELYGLFEARNALREAGYVLVTEGYMDVVALAQMGFPNAVATLGTACTSDHVQKLFRFTDAVVFSFDGDAAGRRAARKALDGALPYATDVRSVKFLFLPPEHDPDSYIREHGKDGFAQYVAQATPLSRFLIEAAQDGCDMDIPEGRAHMAANAGPLWTQLPDGVLKRQLLGEIAALTQLDGRDLEDLWLKRKPGSGGRGGHGGRGEGRAGGAEEGGGHSRRPWQERDGQGGQGGDGGSAGAGAGRAKRPWRDRPASPPGARLGKLRTAPITRADRAGRLLLGQMAVWDQLSAEDHAMLCELPDPHGPLFSWLESQLHEHGPQPWGALREGLREHPSEALALRLMTSEDLSGDEDGERQQAQEDALELRNLLNRMLVQRLKDQETQAIADAAADPAALQRYRELQARRLALEAALAPANPKAA